MLIEAIVCLAGDSQDSHVYSLQHNHAQERTHLPPTPLYQPLKCLSPPGPSAPRTAGARGRLVDHKGSEQLGEPLSGVPSSPSLCLCITADPALPGKTRKKVSVHESLRFSQVLRPLEARPATAGAKECPFLQPPSCLPSQQPLLHLLLVPLTNVTRVSGSLPAPGLRVLTEGGQGLRTGTGPGLSLKGCSS